MVLELEAFEVTLANCNFDMIGGEYTVQMPCLLIV